VSVSTSTPILASRSLGSGRSAKTPIEPVSVAPAATISSAATAT